MAVFTNQATLSYSGGITNSNIVTGELIDAVSVSKTAVSAGYTPGESVSYAIGLVNGGETALTGITVTDDLGGYEFDGQTVYPLAYADGSAHLFVNGVLQAAPTVTAGPPLTVTGIEIPAGGSAVLIYEAEVTRFAPLGAGEEITNTVTVTGIGTALTATATLPMSGEPQLTISKAVSPETVTGNSELTYTFVIQNTGSEPADAAAAIVVSDTFDPVLSGLSVELDGVTLAAGTDYTYDEGTGEFATVAGRITVPGASYTQGDDGSWSVTPGVTVLTVTGTV